MGGLRVKKLSSNAKLPTRAYQDALGYDLYALEDVLIPAVDENGGIGTAKIRTGIAIELPPMWGAFIKDRSSVATKRRLTVVAGVIDNDYRGEIIVCLENHSGRPQKIKAGEKIAQLIPIPIANFEVFEVSDLSKTNRGEKGFGSTGR